MKKSFLNISCIASFEILNFFTVQKKFTSNHTRFIAFPKKLTIGFCLHFPCWQTDIFWLHRIAFFSLAAKILGEFFSLFALLMSAFLLDPPSKIRLAKKKRVFSTMYYSAVCFSSLNQRRMEKEAPSTLEVKKSPLVDGKSFSFFHGEMSNFSWPGKKLSAFQKLLLPANLSNNFPLQEYAKIHYAGI